MAVPQPGICTRCKHPQALHPADRSRRCISPLCECEGFEGEEIKSTLDMQVGGHAPLETDDPLVVLVYVLLRDHIQAGVFERLVAEMVAAPVALTNAFLGGYAINIAERMRLLNPPAAAFVLTTTEREAIEDCISVAGRMASSYECYGGVELPGAIQGAQDALTRMDQELPLPVDPPEDPEQVRLKLADLLVAGRTDLLKKIAIETREPAREVLMQADELLQSIFDAFCPERWKEELAEWDRRHGDTPKPATGVEG
jgi:hypothetical protein